MEASNNHSEDEFKPVIDKYKEWAVSNGHSERLFDGFEGAVNAELVNMYGDVLVEDYTLGKNLKTNVGKPSTQHGEAAEKIEVNLRNKQHILKGESERAGFPKSRIDEKEDFYDGKDRFQAKFYKDAKATLGAFMSDKHDYSDMKKLIPNEQMDEFMELLNKKIMELEQLCKENKANGNMEEYEENLKKLKKARNIKKTVVGSSKGNQRKDAVFAAKHPKLFTAKVVVQDSVEAGVKAGAVAACVTATTQSFLAFCDVIDGKMDGTDAVFEVLGATGKSFAVGAAYGTANTLASSVIKEGTKNVTNEVGKNVLNGIADSNAIVYVAVASISYGKTINAYANGVIAKEDMLIQVGNTTVGLVASIAGNAIGFAAGGPVGAVIGATIANIALGALYRGVVEVYQLNEMADKCSEVLPMIKEAQIELENAIVQFESICKLYRVARYEQVALSWRKMCDSIMDNSINEFMSGLTDIMSIYGKCEFYTDVNEFKHDVLDKEKVIMI